MHAPSGTDGTVRRRTRRSREHFQVAAEHATGDAQPGSSEMLSSAINSSAASASTIRASSATSEKEPLVRRSSGTESNSDKPKNSDSNAKLLLSLLKTANSASLSDSEEVEEDRVEVTNPMYFATLFLGMSCYSALMYLQGASQELAKAFGSEDQVPLLTLVPAAGSVLTGLFCTSVFEGIGFFRTIERENNDGDGSINGKSLTFDGSSSSPSEKKNGKNRKSLKNNKSNKKSNTTSGNSLFRRMVLGAILHFSAYGLIFWGWFGFGADASSDKASSGGNLKNGQTTGSNQTTGFILVVIASLFFGVWRTLGDVTVMSLIRQFGAEGDKEADKEADKNKEIKSKDTKESVSKKTDSKESDTTPSSPVQTLLSAWGLGRTLAGILGSKVPYMLLHHEKVGNIGIPFCGMVLSSWGVIGLWSFWFLEGKLMESIRLRERGLPNTTRNSPQTNTKEANTSAGLRRRSNASESSLKSGENGKAAATAKISETQTSANTESDSSPSFTECLFHPTARRHLITNFIGYFFGYIVFVGFLERATLCPPKSQNADDLSSTTRTTSEGSDPESADKWTPNWYHTDGYLIFLQLADIGNVIGAGTKWFGTTQTIDCCGKSNNNKKSAKKPFHLSTIIRCVLILNAILWGIEASLPVMISTDESEIQAAEVANQSTGYVNIYCPKSLYHKFPNFLPMFFPVMSLFVLWCGMSFGASWANSFSGVNTSRAIPERLRQKSVDLNVAIGYIGCILGCGLGMWLNNTVLAKDKLWRDGCPGSKLP